MNAEANVVVADERNAMALRIDTALFRGDVSKLTDEERVLHLKKVCDSIGVNYLTQPIGYITLPNGKMVPYVKKDGTDQLRKIHSVNIEIVNRSAQGDLLTVHARATDKTGRRDEDFGVVSIAGKRGEDAANAMLKAVTKAKRRVTLSICGLGWLDETETDDIPGAQPYADLRAKEVPPAGNIPDQMRKLEKAEEVSEQRESEASGNAYVLRWQEIMASASTADELKMQWNGERVLRSKITWNDREQPARLKGLITRRIEELEMDKPADAQP